ncbi:MAG: NUDIX hydrolase [Deltaproteobacteria bacterium RIFOXYD12_FULL_50_9]|nr:MAG: NUDIX hydrolase [Deltaproteobacteria bacterium RIFOXYD12_FULL_50_9]
MCAQNQNILCPNCGVTIGLYKNPIPTVDIIIEMPNDSIILIERKNPPYGWALPGGFVDYGESLEKAAQREALEETGLAVTLQGQFHTYSSPDRDKRFHSITTVFIATASGTPQAADDARQAKIFQDNNLPSLVFDHEKIIHDYFSKKRSS